MQSNQERLIRAKQVFSLVGLPKSSVYARIKEGTFPSPVNLGPRAVAWIESEVRAWIDARIAESRGAVIR